MDDAFLLNGEVSDFGTKRGAFVFCLEGDDVVPLLLVETSDTLDDHEV